MWTTKYAPTQLSEIVFGDSNALLELLSIIQSGKQEESFKPLMFHGPAGTGKTTVANVLISELQVAPADTLSFNASDDNSVDHMRNVVIPFCRSYPLGDLKVVLMDEADHLSSSSQAALRGIMDEYCGTVLFILTCNYIDKITAPILSRCEKWLMSPTTNTEGSVARLIYVLSSEGIQYNDEDVRNLVRDKPSDIRTLVSLIEKHSITGTFVYQSVKQLDFIKLLMQPLGWQQVRSLVIELAVETTVVYDVIVENCISRIQSRDNVNLHELAIITCAEWQAREGGSANKHLCLLGCVISINRLMLGK